MPHKNYDIAHLQTMLITEHRIKRAYEQAIDDFMRIYDWMEKPESEDDTLEFDKQPLLKPQVEKIMKRLGQGVNVVVVDGVKASWNLAQEKNNELTRKIFGRAKTKKLSPEQLQAYFTRNEDGLAAFLERKTAGMNLSDRVWKLTESFKEEMEIAIEQGMRDGRSADQLSRDIRQYLKQPNMLFRRVRDKKTGRLRLSKRAANYHPGQGVYRSSYKNARRLAATEGNIAYRTADHERWLNSDFVVGYEIHLSNNHTCLNDQGKAVRFHCMCDDLQGKYPKQFKFTGWHPHCRCFATPILKTEEELARDTQLILEGKEPLPQSENEVKTMPKVFETWMERNQERIANAKSLPYFIKDNFKDGDPLQGYLWNARELTLLEKAKLRHEARTPEQEQAIRDRWEERRKYHKEVKDAASTALATAEEYSEVDTAALQKAVKSGQIARIKKETEKLNKEIQKVVEEEKALGTLIPDVHSWKKQFTTEELKAVHKAVESKLATFEHLSLEHQQNKLAFEVEWMEKTKKYSTWEVAQSAYKKRLEEVQEQIKWQQVNAQITALSAYKTKSPIFKAALEEVITAQKAGDIDAAKAAIKKAEEKRATLEKKKIKKTAVFSQEQKDAALWDKGYGKQADDAHHPMASKTWLGATEDEKDRIYEYTHHYCNVNEPLQGRIYTGYQKKQEFLHRVNNITSYIEKSELEHDAWFNRGDDGLGVIASRIKFAGGEMPNDLQALVGMEMQEGGFMSTGCRKGAGFNKQVTINIFAPKGTKAAYVEPFSEYGNGKGRGWDGTEKFSSFGGEQEMLFQRGTRMRITKVYQEGYRIYIDCEVVAQELKDLSYIKDYQIGY